MPCGRDRDSHESKVLTELSHDFVTPATRPLVWTLSSPTVTLSNAFNPGREAANIVASAPLITVRLAAADHANRPFYRVVHER